MLVFRYVARDASTGQKVKSEVQADSEASAARLIRQQGLTPLEIEPLVSRGNVITRFLGRIKAKDKILFSRQLSTLVNAGLPLVQSLRTVSAQTQNKQFKVVINQVIGDVESGTSLSVAMGRHPEAFDTIYVSLIAAGEVSGTLDVSLERLAFQQEKDAELASKIKGALVYPAIVMLVMVAVVTFMLVGVLPQVRVLYEGMPGAELPLPTKVLLWMSALIVKFWWVFLILLGIGIFFGSRWMQTAEGRSVVDKMKMKAPAIGPLFMKTYMARFSRTGTTLVSSGVPLLQVLEITSKSINNVHVESSLLKVVEKVKGGKSLADSMDGDPNFLELVPNMIRIGEQSGQIESMLLKTAEYYEKEVDQQIKTINTIIEPALMIVLGVVAIVIVLAVLLPIYSLGDSGFGL